MSNRRQPITPEEIQGLVIAGILVLATVWLVRGVEPRTVDAAPAEVIAAQAQGIRFHDVAPGMQTFSPAPAARVACWWANIRQDEGSGLGGIGNDSNPKIPTRSSGLSCIQLDKDGWAEYTERWPIR